MEDRSPFEGWLHVTLASIGDGVITTDAEGRVTMLNEAARSMTGWTPEEARGRPLDDVYRIVEEESRAPIAAAARAFAQDGVDGLASEPILIARDGGETPIDERAVPIRDEAGRPHGLVVVFRGVAERRRAERLLRRSEAEFRQIADSLPQIVWTARPDGYIDYYNERWYEFTGFPRGEYGDPSWAPILHPDDLQRCVDTYYGCIRSGTHYQIEYRFKDRRSGGYRWFLGRANPLRDESGGIVRWFGTCTDIDDTKRAAETTRFLADASAALSRLTDPTQALEDVARLAVSFIADWCTIDLEQPDGSLRRVAAAHCDPEKAQLARELFDRYPPRPFDRHGAAKVHRTGESEWVAAITDEMLVGAARDSAELAIMRELGITSYIGVPLRSRSRTVGVLMLVTAESGRVYDALTVAAAEDLAHRTVIAMENAELLAALRESDRRKDEFLAMLAHELRNPLAPIRNAVQIVRLKSPPVPELQWASEVIERQIHQMTRLVDDLLDVSRITRGRVELRKERTDLCAVVRGAVEASRSAIEKGGHELVVTLPPEPIEIDGDPIRLSQVVQNLLSNAAKYMDRRGRVSLAVACEGDEVAIRVEDTGIGIDAEMLSSIFDMFTQVDRSLDRSEGGLGIGLTLVRSLVEMHGGSVEARSDGPHTGSEFVVRLPRSAGEPARPAAVADETEPDAAAPARRVLIVDDNRDAAESLAMLLRMMGHEVETAHDGVEAVGAASSFGPDLVLLDIGLPKLDGYEVARRLREQADGRSPVLAALTGWGQEEDRRRSREAGFDHHLTKPVDLDALRKLLADS